MSGADCMRELRLANVPATKEDENGKCVRVATAPGLRDLVAQLRAGSSRARLRPWPTELEPPQIHAMPEDLVDANAAVKVAKKKIVGLRSSKNAIDLGLVTLSNRGARLAEALSTRELPIVLSGEFGAENRARSLGFFLGSIHPLANQLTGAAVPELQSCEKAPASMTPAELLPALVASIRHMSTMWSTLSREHRVEWLAGQLQYMHRLRWSTNGISRRCREKLASRARWSRLHGFSSEADNKKRSEGAHTELIFCHDELTRSKGLTGEARQQSRQKARRPCGSRKVLHAQDVLWGRERDALARHRQHDSIEPGTDMLAQLHAIPGASDGGKGQDGYRRASSQSMDILRTRLAVELDAPVRALHGEDPEGVPLLTGGQLVNVQWGTPDVSTPAQVVKDAMKAVSIVKDTLRDEDGELHFDDSGRRLQGEAHFGPALLAKNQTLTVYTRASNHSENLPSERSDGVLKRLADCGPAFAQMVAALRKGRDSLAIAERILRLDYLFYMTTDELMAIANGFWHARC